MMRFISIVGVVGVLVASQSANANEKGMTTEEIHRHLSGMPLTFTPNEGQWDENVLFHSRAPGAMTWFLSDGFSVQLRRNHERDGDHGHNPSIRATFIGANPSPVISGLNPVEFRSNYFLGNEPERWCTDVPAYERITYTDVYPGIDLVFYGNGEEMEYDFVILPGADPSQILIEISGAASLRSEKNGDMVIETELGTVTQRSPFVYQEIDGARKQISGRFDRLSQRSFGFVLGDDYDSNVPVVIDPSFDYSTYLGGASDEEALDVAVDAAGNAYVVGWTTSTGFPAVNAYDGTHGGGKDVFVSKLSPSGSSLVFSTFLGHSGEEEARAVTIDGDLNVYVAGYTTSSSFPLVNPIDNSRHLAEAFIAKLGPSGNSLLFSSYLGGQGNDTALAIAYYNQMVYVVGQTTSSSVFPLVNTYGPIDNIYAGPSEGFVATINPVSSTLHFCNYLGGSGADRVADVTLDGVVAISVTGTTTSSNFLTYSAADNSLNGSSDAFVTVFEHLGSEMYFSTYLGGNGADTGQAIASNTLAEYFEYFVTGVTNSTSGFPLQGTPFQNTYGGGAGDAFLTIFQTQAGARVYSTYLGGSGWDAGSGIEIEPYGDVFIAGMTESADFDILNPADAPIGGSRDAFVTRFGPAFPSYTLISSTYLGGSGSEGGGRIGLAVDFANDAAFVVGKTTSADFPRLFGYDNGFEGGSEAFLTKVDCCTSCECDCHTDPDCSGYHDIIDYIKVRDVANGTIPPIPDPNPLCPVTTTDVNCDGITNIQDKTLMHGVVFLSKDPCIEFCHPCAGPCQW